jgi:hypothetical protein
MIKYLSAINVGMTCLANNIASGSPVPNTKSGPDYSALSRNTFCFQLYMIRNMSSRIPVVRVSRVEDCSTWQCLDTWAVGQYSRLSIIRAWFNRFAAQPRQCIFKEKILFSVSITFV